MCHSELGKKIIVMLILLCINQWRSYATQLGILHCPLVKTLRWNYVHMCSVFQIALVHVTARNDAKWKVYTVLCVQKLYLA